MEWDDYVEASHYKPAAICRRGHVETIDLTTSEVSKRCAECGAEILTACPSCQQRIRGYHDTPGIAVAHYDKPSFCDECGAPYPWVDRKGRIYELENILDAQDLDPANELTVREQLQALRDPELSDDEVKRRWGRVRELAPGLWEQGKPILDTVISAAIKAQMGLP